VVFGQDPEGGFPVSREDDTREMPIFGPNTACPSFGTCACDLSCAIAGKALMAPGVFEAGAILAAVQNRQAELRYIDRGGLPFVEREFMFKVVNDIARERFGSAWVALMRGEVSAESLGAVPSTPAGDDAATAEVERLKAEVDTLRDLIRDIRIACLGAHFRSDRLHDKAWAAFDKAGIGG
jgi:hypothetical protein